MSTESITNLLFPHIAKLYSTIDTIDIPCYLGLDVESANTKNLDRIMSNGWAVVDINGRLLEKQVIYFPFHLSHMQYNNDEYDSLFFWCSNSQVFLRHIKHSYEMGFNPYEEIAPNEKMSTWKNCMRQKILEFSDALYRIQNTYNIQAIITDCQYDTTVINHLLWKWLKEDALTMKRIINEQGVKSVCWV